MTFFPEYENSSKRMVISQKNFIRLTWFSVLALAILFVGMKSYSWILHARGVTALMSNDLKQIRVLAENRQWLATQLLSEAYKKTNRDAFALLLEIGANPDEAVVVGEWGGEGLIHKAAEHNDSFWLERLLAHGADPDRPFGRKKVVPLVYAIENHRTENGIRLIASDANVDFMNDGDCSLISYAMSFGEYRLVHEMLINGADYNAREPIATSLIFELKYILQDSQRDFTLENARKHGTLPYLEKILKWFEDQRLDWKNATYDESTGNVPKTWNIPRLPEPVEE